MWIAKLYFIASFIFFGLFIFFIIAYEKTLNKYVRYYALAFLTMFLFTFALSVPVLIDPTNSQVLSYAHSAAVFFVFCLIFLCFRIQLLVTNHFFKKHFNLFNIILFILGAITLYFVFSDLKAPTINKKYVIWHINFYAGMILGILSIVYGLFWAYLFGKVAKMLQNKQLRRRMIVLSINGVLYGLASFFLFGMDNLLGQVLSIILFTVSGVFSSWVFIAPFIKEFMGSRQSVKATLA